MTLQWLHEPYVDFRGVIGCLKSLTIPPPLPSPDIALRSTTNSRDKDEENFHLLWKRVHAAGIRLTSEAAVEKSFIACDPQKGKKLRRSVGDSIYTQREGNFKTHAPAYARPRVVYFPV